MFTDCSARALVGAVSLNAGPRREEVCGTNLSILALLHVNTFAALHGETSSANTFTRVDVEGTSVRVVAHDEAVELRADQWLVKQALVLALRFGGHFGHARCAWRERENE